MMYISMTLYPSKKCVRGCIGEIVNQAGSPGQRILSKHTGQNIPFIDESDRKPWTKDTVY